MNLLALLLCLLSSRKPLIDYVVNAHFTKIRSRRIEVWFPQPETPTPQNVVHNHHSMILCLFTSLVNEIFIKDRYIVTS